MRLFNKKNVIWLIPGIQIKRWFALSVTASVLAAIGVTFLFRLEPLYFMVEKARELFHVVPAEAAGIFLIFMGVILFILAWEKTNFSMMDDSNADSM